LILKSKEYINIITIAVKSFFILTLILSLCLLAVLFLYSYDEITALVMSNYGKSEKLEIFRTNYLTIERFNIVRLFLSILTASLILASSKLSFLTNLLVSKIYALLNSVKDFYNYLKQEYVRLSGAEKIYFYSILIFISCFKFYFLIKMAFHVDEVFTYLYFVKRGFFVTITYYPGPNNHIFYSVITWLMQPFFSDPFYLMKIPSFIMSIIFSAILFLFLKKHFSFNSSALGMIVFSLAGCYFMYSISGRGYALMTGFTMIAFFVTLEIISGRNEKFLWHAYVAASILGFYTMIIFLYPLVSMALAMISSYIQRKSSGWIKPFLYYHLIIIVGVLFLYMPVFLVSGVSSVVSSGWMIKLDWPEYFNALPSFINGAFSYILNIEEGASVVGIIIILISLFILFKMKRQNWRLLILFFFVTPLILLMIQRVIPYDRVWTYMILPLSLCLVIIIEFLFSLTEKYKLEKSVFVFLFSFGIFLHTFFHFKELTDHGLGLYDDVSRISSYVVVNSSAKVYTNEDSYNLYIRYESAQRGNEIIPEMDPGSATNRFNYILLVPGTLFPGLINKTEYVLKEKNKYIEVYELKM
jgi:hypothetical protein